MSKNLLKKPPISTIPGTNTNIVHTLPFEDAATKFFAMVDRNEPFDTIALVGDAGFGKSTFVSYIKYEIEHSTRFPYHYVDVIDMNEPQVLTHEFPSDTSKLIVVLENYGQLTSKRYEDFQQLKKDYYDNVNCSLVFVIVCEKNESMLDPFDCINFEPCFFGYTASIYEDIFYKTMSKYNLTCSKKQAAKMIQFAFQRCQQNYSKFENIISQTFAYASATKEKLSVECFKVVYGEAFYDFSCDKKHNKTFSIAIHEAGHALAKYLLFGELSLISIIAAYDFLGRTTYVVNLTNKSTTYYQNILVKVAGSVAESMFGYPLNTGYSSDLREATNIAKKQLMLSKHYPSQASSDFIDKSLAKDIDVMFKKARKDAKKLLKPYKKLLKKIALKCEKEKILTYEELYKLYKKNGI